MAKLTITNLEKGLAPRYWEGFDDIIVPGDGFYTDGFLNPLFKTGFIYPISGDYTEIVGDISGNQQLDAEGQVVQYIHTLGDVTQSGTDFVWLFYDNDIHLLDLEDEEILESQSIEVGTSLAQPLRDAVSYQVNGSAKILYAFNDDVGSMDHDGNNTNHDMWSTDADGGAILDSSFDIVMEVSDNGFCYVGNGNNLYRFDGTSSGGANGSVKTALTFIAPMKILDMVDTNGFLWIATEQYLLDKDSSGYDESSDKMIAVYVWDRKTTEIGQDDFIILDDATALYSMFILDGTPHCIIQDKSGVIKLMGYSGGRFQKIRELGDASGGRSDARPSYRNSVRNYRNGIVWHAKGGSIFYYGSLSDGKQKSLHRIGRRQADNTDEIGSLFVAKDDKFYVQTVSSDTDRLEKFEVANGSASVQSNTFINTKFYQLPTFSRINWVKIWFKEFTANSSSSNFQVNMYKNFNGTALFNKSFSYEDIDSKGFINFPVGGQVGENISSLAFQFQFSSLENIEDSPGIYRIEVEYEPTSKKI